MYLQVAKDTLGTMLDYAVNEKGCKIDSYFERFIRSGVAYEFENGNPTFITGKNGIELYQIVTGDYNHSGVHSRSYSRSWAYWVGWALAYYQWTSGKTFAEIVRVFPLSEMSMLYPTLHEADVMRTVEYIDSRFRQTISPLKTIRQKRGFSQKMLAQISSVSESNIRKYEKDPSSINTAQINILMALARTLNCDINELLGRYNFAVSTQDNAVDNFGAQLRQRLSYNEQRLSQLKWEKAQMEDRNNSYSFGYLAQFPYSNMTATKNSSLQINQSSFEKNWEAYWDPIIASNSTNGTENKTFKSKVIEIGKLALDVAAVATQNKEVKLASDIVGLITADSLEKAVVRTISLVNTMSKKPT